MLKGLNSRMRRVLSAPFWAATLCVTVPFLCVTLASDRLDAQSHVFPVRYESGVVVSESSLASTVGLTILQRGGNAIDAAVATAFALAVVHPRAGNIGGGGFLVVRLSDGRTATFDFRERAPLAATERMFLDEDGQYDRARHHWGATSVGTPGSVAGLALAHERWGRRPWRELVAPAVKLARDGFSVTAPLATSLREVATDLRKYPASWSQFTKEGTFYEVGDRLAQPSLGRTLARIRDRGVAGFYEGETADLLVAEMKRRNGLITHADLKSYEAVERPAVTGNYRGYEIIGMGPPSSGGIAVVEMLHLLERFPLRRWGSRSARATHVIVEAMRRAFADRARYIGDPDYVEVPLDRLTSKEHAQARAQSIGLERASVSSPSRFTWPPESSETTHLSVVDRDHMAVALTTTLERSYGCRIVVPGAGFLLNNEMGDFNPERGQTTVRGQIGTEPNLVAPQKRMVSSMSPTIVARDGQLRLVVGSPGGRTIINSVLLTILRVVDFGMPVQEAIDAPRFHHQWLPDRIRVERWCFSTDTRQFLERMGHTVELNPTSQGSVMAVSVVEVDGQPLLEAGVDRRRGGGGAAGY